MRYLIWTTDNNADLLYASAPVPESNQSEFLARVLPRFLPISATFYIESFAPLVQAAVPMSYLLSDGKLYWCLLWQADFLALEVSPDGALRAAAVRRLDDESPSLLSPLVMDPWESQEDLDDYRANGFAPACDQTVTEFLTCIEQLDHLAPKVEQRFLKHPDTFLADCQANLRHWVATAP